MTRLLLPLALLLGCSTAPAPVRGATLADDADAPRVHGSASRIYPTPCRTRDGVLPYVWWHCDYYGTDRGKDFPRVNTWALLTGMRGSISSPADRPVLAAWAIGHRLLASPLWHPDAPGCQLLVDPIVILPAPHAAPPWNLSMGAWSEGGTAFLLLRPEPATLGHHIYVQLGLFATGDNALWGGTVVSHVVDLWIGNTTP